ncbi:MAG: NUDIX domain-containing protein [Methanospirillum sp.]
MDRDPDGPLNLVAHAAIADRRGRLLLLRRPDTSADNPGRWELPGGPIGPGEGVRGALVRGVREKTGLDAKPGRLLGAGDQSLRRGHVVHLVLGATVHNLEVVLSGEYDGYRWVTPKGLAELPLSNWMEGWYGAQRE